MKCPGCNFNTNNVKEFENHLLDYHFLTYKDYSEIELLTVKNKDYYCYRCKLYRSPLTFIDPEFYYLPCSECTSIVSKKTEKLGIVQTIVRNIKEYYDKLLGDRYLQLFLIKNEYFESIPQHNYQVFKAILGKLQLPSRNDIWMLDWYPGFPKIIDESNLMGIQVLNLTSNYNIVNNKTDLIIDNYKILPPEIIPYDVSHHCRYSIFNKTSNRKTKRLRISNTDNCIKFYNNSRNEFKTIFKILNIKTGEFISPENISENDLFVIKLSLLRNKTYVRHIFDVVYEFLKVTNIFRDGVFLRNTIEIDSSKSICLNLSWTSNDNFKDNYINISIL